VPDALTADHAQPADSPKRGAASWRRRLVELLIVTAVLFPAAALDAAPVDARGSCTGWHSRVVPPTSIRVLRKSGRVEKVNFRRYVAVVMGSGEWPYWMPQAALEAGAVAVKQFAWYHTLAGHHRSSYYDARGQCYDVRDGTRDQIYRPERARIRTNMLRAIDQTWSTSLRRNGNFILTPYRAGRRNPCGSDSDGRKMFQKSVMDCARRGWSAKRIHARYYGPNLSIVRAGQQELAVSDRPDAADASPETADASPETADASPETAVTSPAAAVAGPPAPGAPAVALRTGPALDAAPAFLSWSAASSDRGPVRYELESLADGAWRAVGLESPREATVATTVQTDGTLQYRVRSVDATGATSEWVEGLTVSTHQIEDRSTEIAWRGNWHRLRGSSVSGGTVRYTGLAGSSVTFRFTGRAVALVGASGPGRGQAYVYENGELAATVDLYTPDHKPGVVFFARNWTEVGTRTIRLEVRGTSGRGRIDLDSILTLR
jgi:hypothetical protein